MASAGTPMQAWGSAGWALVVLAACSAALQADRPLASEHWKFDVLHLKNGKQLRGLIEAETATEFHFAYILRKTGRPTSVFHTSVPRKDVTNLDRLDAEERRLLTARLRALDPKAEKRQMETLKVTPAPWNSKPHGGLAYPSEYFVLLSDAREDIVRRSALRLEQIYNAYARLLPPRTLAAQPTRILLISSLDEYRALLRQQGRLLANPAFYDAARNQICCATDLAQLGAELETIRKEHQDLRERLREQEAQWVKQFKNKIPQDLLDKLAAARRTIERTNEENDRRFERATQRLFRTLYHEAFHAYFLNFVYSPKEAEVPRWLNEGLAQIFETAILEAGELRLGHADPDRLAQVKTALRKSDFLPLRDLLLARPQEFLVEHGTDQQLSDRHYLASWALAFYLTFDRFSLGTPELDRYVHALKEGIDPVTAFVTFAGLPLTEFEKGFHEYLGKLQTDGRVEDKSIQ